MTEQPPLTDDELRSFAEQARKRAVKVGSMSTLWDIITDIEAILAGRQSILTRAEMEQMIRRLEPRS